MRALVGGVVHTMAGGRAEAVAYDGRTVVAVGTREEVLAAAGPGANVHELAGKAVVPGFIDAHHHMCLAAFYEGCLHLGPAKRVAEILARVRAVAAATAEGGWVLCYDYDDALLAERRHPTRRELDEASPDHPVCLMHYSFHEAVASSRALALAGIDRHTSDPPGGVIARGKGGEPTGHLVEIAYTRVEALARESRAVRGADDYLRRLRGYQQRLFAAGITRVVDAMVAPMFEALYRRARDEGELTIPVVMLPGSAEGTLARPHDRIDVGSRTGEGDEGLRTGPLKLAFDGANRCAICLTFGRALSTAARTIGEALTRLSMEGLRKAREAPARWGSDRRLRTGVLYYDLEAARAVSRRAHDAGLGVAIHAIGNEAIDQALAAHFAAPARGAFPSRIEHASLVAEEQVRRLADAGIVVVAQPGFIALPAVDSLTIPTGVRYVRLRSLLDAGVRVAGSSDAPVASFDVLAGIASAVGRRRRSGRTLHAEEAIDVETALALYTREAAFAAGCSDTTGTIEVGKRADLVVLGGDPCEAGVDLSGMAVEETVLGGQTVFSREPT